MKGWRLTTAASCALGALFALQLVFWGADEEGIRVVVRASARTSIVLFSLAFGASSAWAFWRNGATKWLLANRRYVGVSYAVSHAFHALALVALYQASAEFRADLNIVTLGGGGLAYAFTLAMALTSTDAAVAALGRRRWHLLHTVGGWYIWVIFAQSYLPRAIEMPSYLPAGALVLAVAAARLARRVRRPAAAGA